MRLCTFNGCGRRYSYNGLCKSHIRILNTERELRPIYKIGNPRTNKGKICFVLGCENKVLAKNYCTKHYHKLRRNKPAKKGVNAGLGLQQGVKL